jgi:two-component system, OmpR family, sensor kinase
MRRLPDRTPLRVKLIAAVLALVAIALLVISVAGLAFLRKDLLAQADSNVSGSVRSVASHFGYVQSYLADGNIQEVAAPVAGVWLPNGRKPQLAAQEVTGYAVNAQGQPTGGEKKPGPKVAPGASWLSGNEFVTVGATSGNGRWRVLALPNQVFVGPSGAVVGTVVVAWDVSSTYQTIGELTSVDVVVSAILLLGLAILGVGVVRASLRPLTDIEKTAEAIAAGDLSQRVPDRDPHTEIGRLGRSLNTMLAQIEVAFHARSASELAARRSEDRMRQFVADASHELRTPLTAIRGFAEYYRQRGGVDVSGRGQLPGTPQRAGLPASQGPGADLAESGAAGASPNPPARTGLAPAELDRIMRRVEQESSRMGILVEDMLLLARLDQQRPLEHRTVDLLTLAADAVHDARVVAPDRSIHLTVGAGTAPLVLGDEVRLRQVIGNLMSNAMAHTPPGTPIDVHIRSGSLDEASAPGVTRPGPAGQLPPPAPQYAGARSAAVLEVTDHGPGLTREQAEHAFERFYRADQARTTGGTGLGLAIVAALVAAHGGTVWVESVPGVGATFRIALPLAPEALHLETDPDDTDLAAPGTPGTPASPASPPSPAAPASPGTPASPASPPSPASPGTPGTPPELRGTMPSPPDLRRDRGAGRRRRTPSPLDPLSP